MAHYCEICMKAIHLKWSNFKNKATHIQFDDTFVELHLFWTLYLSISIPKILIWYICKLSEKHYSEILISVIHKTCMNLENKKHFPFNFQQIDNFVGSSFALGVIYNHLNSWYNEENYEMLIKLLFTLKKVTISSWIAVTTGAQRVSG